MKLHLILLLAGLTIFSPTLYAAFPVPANKTRFDTTNKKSAFLHLDETDNSGKRSGWMGATSLVLTLINGFLINAVVHSTNGYYKLFGNAVNTGTLFYIVAASAITAIVLGIINLRQKRRCKWPAIIGIWFGLIEFLPALGLIVLSGHH